MTDAQSLTLPKRMSRTWARFRRPKRPSGWTLFWIGYCVWYAYAKKLDDATAEVRRLRAALEQIQREDHKHGRGWFAESAAEVPLTEQQAKEAAMSGARVRLVNSPPYLRCLLCGGDGTDMRPYSIGCGPHKSGWEIADEA